MAHSEEDAMLPGPVFDPAGFAAPSAAWRGKPFWSWNGKLEKDELIRQIHVLKEMGMGGFFMHSRTGLVTEYLGDEWFELTNACAEEGERLGMEGWLYDEDRWPSGTAGGRVTANPEFRMKFIHLAKFAGEAFDLEAWEREQDRPLGAWSCRMENDIDIFDVAPVRPDTPPGQLAGKTVLAFRIMPMAGGSFYNGNTYVDTMKREATEEYIRLTHEQYKKRCGRHFGKGIKGIFTDEPHRGGFMSGFGLTGNEGVDATCLVPWTDAIFDAFAAMHGTRVEASLPALFLREDGQEVTPLKAQYAETMLALFLDNFARPYYDWCDDNKLLVTGHVLHENSLSCQVSTNGSVQRYYPLMHIPGMDYLGEHGRDYWVAKQVDSTARQFNRRWILSELYAGTGWQMNFESHKAIGAWQALFGVNLRCHHLSWYTMAGEAKRDYPASIFHQSPWYKEYSTVETWFARLGYFRSQGEPCCDLLVLNPVESLWGRVYPGAIKVMYATDGRMQALEKTYAELFHILAGHQIDFDYGDEALLAGHGAMDESGGTAALCLGAMRYTTVLVAGADTLRATTLAILQQFIGKGGRVIFAGELPGYVDSLPSAAVRDLADSAMTCAFEEAAVIQALEGHTPRRVRIADAASGQVARDVFCQLRASNDAFYLTVLNTSRDETRDVTIALSGITGRMVEEWDLETGRATQLPPSSHRSGNHPTLRNPTSEIAFSTSLHTSQARCFRIVDQSSLPMADSDGKGRGEPELHVLDRPARYSLAGKNICVLDMPAWSLDGGDEQPVDDILRIDQEIRRRLGVPIRAGDMVQPWFRGKEVFPALGNVTLRYHIRIEAGGAASAVRTPGADTFLHGLELVMETPERFSLALNGTPIETSRDDGWWVDIAFRRIPVPAALLRKGDNELVVTCKFSEDINLEAMYLLGDFAVDAEGATPCLGPLPENLAPGSIVGQGFPYYSDSITYHYPVPEPFVGRRTTVRVPAYEGAYLKVRSRGETRMIPWRPNEAELVLGDTLDVEICITRKNTFGPLHLKNPRPGYTNPGRFTPHAGQFSLKPTFMESGLLAPVELRNKERRTR